MRLFMLATVSVAFTGSALAQQAPLQGVYACAGITKADERLACYDAAVGSLKQAEASGGVAVISREQIAQAEKQSFGLGPATLADATRNAATAAPAESLDKIQVSVASVAKLPRGALRLTLDNGQVWEELEEGLKRVPQLPARGEIRKGAIGSFLLKVGDRAPVRVRRVK